MSNHNQLNDAEFILRDLRRGLAAYLSYDELEKMRALLWNLHDTAVLRRREDERQYIAESIKE